jgi:hypothetical protein
VGEVPPHSAGDFHVESFERFRPAYGRYFEERP